MSGQFLKEYTQLAASVSPSWMSGADVMVNAVTRNTYTGPRFTSGKDMSMMLNGGTEIRDRIFLEARPAYHRYNPNFTTEAPNYQTGDEWSVPWALATAPMSWTKHEIQMNVGQGAGRAFRRMVYKRVLRQKHQNLWTDVCEGREKEYWARPDFDLMESSDPSGPRVPYSIPVYVNEFTDGLPDANVDVKGATWTTKMQINPTTRPNWVPYQRTYTFHSTTNTVNIFAALSACMHKTKFARLPKRPEFSDKATSPRVIFCSLQGMLNYEHALRTNQDEFRGIGKVSGQDPDYNNPTFRNVPLDYIEELDTAAVYSDGSAAVDELNATLAGPRYYGITGENMKLVHHDQNYAVLEEPMKDVRQPFTWVQHMDQWDNFICNDMRKHFNLSPSASTTDV